MSIDTVLRWVADQGLPCVRVGRAIRFEPEAVQAWIKEHRST